MSKPFSIELFAHTSGSRTPRVIIVGEAWGKEESAARVPFVGESGREFLRMLGEAFRTDTALLQEALSCRHTGQFIATRDEWLRRNDILLTNVIDARPENNDFTTFLFSNAEAKKRKEKGYHGVFLRPPAAAGVSKLWALLSSCRPELVIAAGNWPLHILTEHAQPKTAKGYKLPTGIGTWRGSQTYSRPLADGSRLKVLPIIHPAAVLREWGYRHITVHDLRSRACRYLSGSLPWEAPTDLAISKPTMAQVRGCFAGWLAAANAGELWLSVDLETYAKTYISCMGIADATTSLCIPFFYFSTSQRSIDYWLPAEELEIWKLTKQLIEHPNVRIIGQNFMYDTQYFDKYCIDAKVSFDTGVGHHLLFPGTRKTLEMLASLYCNSYCYWKDEAEEWAASEIAAEDLWLYNCKDIRATYEIAMLLRRLIDRQGMRRQLAERLEEWELAREMSLRGINYDNELRHRYREALSGEAAKLEEWLMSAVPEQFRYNAGGGPWFTSAQATMFILYEVAGLKPVLNKKTRKPTSDDNAINELSERADAQWLSPLLERLQDMRSALISARTFLNMKLGYDDRLHPHYKIDGTKTYRWSSGENAFGEGGPMQNTPKIKED